MISRFSLHAAAVLFGIALWSLVAAEPRAQTPTGAPPDSGQASVFDAPSDSSQTPSILPDAAGDSSSQADRQRRALPDPERTGVKRTLIRRYQAARNRLLARRMLDEAPRPVPVRSPAWLPVTDTLGLVAEAEDDPAPEDDEASGFPVREVRLVPRLGYRWFSERFADTEWSYLGTSRALSLFDTTKTRDLRARLQAQFGAPTRTIGDFESAEAREEAGYPQFEYWFVVNGNLPVIVSDANGPRDRGVILATAARHRDSLKAIRRALLAPIRASDRAPYADYYYEPDAGRWYRTGFDGRRFFRERVYRYQLVPGRRAWVDPVASDSSETGSPVPR